MMLKRLIAGALVMGSLSGCGEETKEETIKIGTLLSTTGALAHTGGQNLKATALAVEQINAAGGVLGKKLELVNKDDGSDEAKAATAAQALVDEGVPAILGAVGSGFTLAAAEVATPKGIVMISASSTSPLITTFGDDGFLFRTCPSDAFQGKLLGRRAIEKGFSKVSVLFVNGAYGEGLATNFKQAFEGAGGSVLHFEGYDEGVTNFRDHLDRAFANGPQAILLASYEPDGGQIIKDFKNSSYAGQGTFFFFGDSLANQAFIDIATPGNLNGVQNEGSAPHAGSGPVYDVFAEAFQARYGENVEVYDANAYDAVFLLALAIEKAGKAEGAAIRDALPDVSAGGTAYGPAQFKEAVEALKRGEDIDFDGASGAVDLDANGDTTAPYDVWTVEGGNIQVIQSKVAVE